MSKLSEFVKSDTTIYELKSLEDKTDEQVIKEMSYHLQDSSMKRGNIYVLDYDSWRGYFRWTVEVTKEYV